MKQGETGARRMNLGSRGLHRERRSDCVRSEDVSALLPMEKTADLSTNSGKVRKEKKKKTGRLLADREVLQLCSVTTAALSLKLF